MDLPICSPLPWNVLADPQKLLTTTIITESESSSWRIFKPFLSNQFNGISGNYWLLLHIQDIRLKSQHDLDLLAPNCHYPFPIPIFRSVSFPSSHTLRWCARPSPDSRNSSTLTMTVRRSSTTVLFLTGINCRELVDRPLLIGLLSL